MDTLIELCDERPMENVLATDVFRPKRTVFICEKAMANDKDAQKKLREYFRYRGVDTELDFFSAKQYSASSVLTELKKVVSMYPECVLDITGGTDDELFASGLLCAEKDIPVFTYSIKLNRFFNINRASFPDGLECTVQYCVEDFFRMAGGAMRSGRVDNRILSNYSEIFEPFFNIYLENRRNWGNIITYMQQISRPRSEGEIPLSVSGEYVQKGARGKRIEAPVKALRAFEKIGMIRELNITAGEKVEFSFADRQIRSWLRDIGGVLELYTYKLFCDSGLFNDVRTSVVVDWEKNSDRNGVTNEIDVMAVKNVTPVFVSCKTCAVSTEALNELAILRDRFGGSAANAMIVTTERGTAPMRSRAQELAIQVIELDDFLKGRAAGRINAFMQPKF